MCKERQRNQKAKTIWQKKTKVEVTGLLKLKTLYKYSNQGSGTGRGTDTYINGKINPI